MALRLEHGPQEAATEGRGNKKMCVPLPLPQSNSLWAYDIIFCRRSFDVQKFTSPGYGCLRDNWGWELMLGPAQPCAGK